MPVTFKELKIGEQYERPYLAELWGYKGFQAISRGVITPSGTNYIILFVTKEKQEVLTQYNDYIDGNRLYWEGEKKHSSDTRIVDASKNNDEIHLFYRDKHHSPFVYFGQIFLDKYELHSNTPSQFIFTIPSNTPELDPIEDIRLHEQEYKSLEKTEKESIIKSRIGQGIFRERLIAYWGGCAVTGLSNVALLRASHIKPWRDSSNSERLDPMNGLLLQPTLDHLFDTGFITFDEDGEIVISNKLSQEDIKKLAISPSSKLRNYTNEHERYMQFHRTHVFIEH